MGWKRRISNCSCNFLKATYNFFYFIPKVKNVFLWPLTCSCLEEELSQFITLYFPVMECFFSSFSPSTNPHPPPTQKRKHFASAGSSELDAQKIIQCPFLWWLARSVQAQCNHSSTIPSNTALNCNLVDLLLGVIYYIPSPIDSDRAINGPIKNKRLSAEHLFLLHKSLVNTKIYYLSNALPEHCLFCKVEVFFLSFCSLLHLLLAHSLKVELITDF